MAAVLRFDAALEDFKGVTRSIEVREDQTLVDLHEGIQQAFGWLNDHLYSFWLDGRFWVAHPPSTLLRSRRTRELLRPTS
ncbi:MAG: plasmid pRiA4b ORF-3 family protein [Actinobacteria bacterium]|nr:MAG: plasmid pRiA4b ORF-3 family protein [Actinomycetota bacterium]